MKRSKTVLIAMAAAVLLAGGAAPARAANMLAASWMVTYYLDPLGTQGATDCINFNKTGETNGVVSGVWNSPTVPTWNGEWIQKGSHYSWHGFYTKSGAKIATYDVGDFINANLTAEPSIGAVGDGSHGPTTIHTGTATMVQVASCSGLPVRRFSDPMTGR